MIVISLDTNVNTPNRTSNFFKMPKEIEENDFHEIFESDHKLWTYRQKHLMVP